MIQTKDVTAGYGKGGLYLHFDMSDCRQPACPKHEKGPPVRAGLEGRWQRSAYFLARSKRSSSMTLVHAATKSVTNFSLASALA